MTMVEGRTPVYLRACSRVPRTWRYAAPPATGVPRDGPRDLVQYRCLRLICDECNVRFQAAYNIKTTTATTWSTTIPWIAYDANYFDRNPFPR